MRTLRWCAAVLVGAVLSASCGARLDDEQLRVARSRAATEVPGEAGAAVDGPTDLAGGAIGADPLDGAPTAGAAGGPTGASGDARRTGAGPAAATSLPPGGNGGATDVGVTATEILVGNVSTLSGPVPGLFQGAVIGSQAFVEYYNARGGVHGRKLKLVVRDDQFDSGQNRAQTIDLIPKVFGFVGSFSLYDDAAAPQVRSSGIPDVTYSLAAARFSIPNNFSPQPLPPGWRLGAANYHKARHPDAVKSVGALYGAIPSAEASYRNQKAAFESVGYEFIYERGYQPTETDFTADVVRMRQAGVKIVALTAMDVRTLARVSKAMLQQGFEPELFITGGIGYDPQLVPLAGAEAVEGLINDQTYAMFGGEDSSAVPEVALMNQWMQKVKPGYKPDLFSLYGWTSGRLMAEALEAVGPRVTRAATIAALRKIDPFDANGLLAPGGPGTKRPTSCYLMVQVKGGRFSRYDSPQSSFRCGDGGFFRR